MMFQALVAVTMSTPMLLPTRIGSATGQIIIPTMTAMSPVTTGPAAVVVTIAAAFGNALENIADNVGPTGHD
jgi:hypothetical protein